MRHKINNLNSFQKARWMKFHVNGAIVCLHIMGRLTIDQVLSEPTPGLIA